MLPASCVRYVHCYKASRSVGAAAHTGSGAKAAAEAGPGAEAAHHAQRGIRKAAAQAAEGASAQLRVVNVQAPCECMLSWLGDAQTYSASSSKRK